MSDLENKKAKVSRDLEKGTPRVPQGPVSLDQWLEETAWDRIYWSDVRSRAQELKADGCSGVPDWMVWTCLEHDVHYRTHKTLNGTPITKTTSDYVFRVRIQQGSALGRFSPVSWWRWLGVKYLGKKAWEEFNGNVSTPS
jgi:hypothetical protein